nr:EAL domain-containing protein [Pseudoalteromonas sp. MMG010]
MLQSQEKQLVFEEHENLKFANDAITLQLKRFLSHKESLAIEANKVVYNELFINKSLSIDEIPPLVSSQSDGPIRSISEDGVSGAFIPHQISSPYTEQLLQQTQLLWQFIAPSLIHEFLNFYVVNQDNFIRVSPHDLVNSIDSNHEFTKESSYILTQPENNPDRLAVWSKTYFDDVWQQQVVSLTVPIYLNDAFWGLTGVQLSLNTLLEQLLIEDQKKQLVVFDNQGHLLFHPKLHEKYVQSMGRAGKGVYTQNFLNSSLQQIVSKVISTQRNSLADSFQQEGLEYIININKIPKLNWYVGVYEERSRVHTALMDLKIKFFGLFVLYAIFVTLLLHQALYQLVLRRIHALVYAVTSFGRGRLDTEFPSESKDEIGVLNASFKDMSVEISKLINGLNQRINEKEVAEKAANRLSKAVAFSGTGVVLTDNSFNIEYVNPKMLEMTGFSESHFIDESLLSIVASEMSVIVKDISTDLHSRNYWRGDTLIAAKDKKPTWVSLSVSPIRDSVGTITSYVASAQDISFIKESQRKMEHLAYFDTLTGLANRTFFRMQLRKSMALAKRGHFAFALFYFDLDEFKRINDTLGHDSGDQLLIEVANRLKKRLRIEDTIARLGGDEFAVLLSGIEEQAHATDVANTIQKTINEPIKLGNNEVIISASIGITMAPHDSLKEDLLLKHADLAMYEAKAKGRNTFHFYSQELNAAANERLFLESELRLAMKKRQFSVHYQAQVDSRSNDIIGYEALIRWEHPTEGYISPFKFIPVAEATGIIVELGAWVLQQACKFAVRLEQQERASTVSVNLSARQFKDANLVFMLKDIIKKTGVNTKNLHLELTESMLMGHVEAAITQLHELKALGVSISIDDFGTGYSSLSYLKRFPVDVLKIDRSFIMDIPDDDNDAEITAAIIAMAQKLNLDVVAEGVETVEQIEFLQKNNCFIVQGYYYSKPIPEQELSQLFKRLG